MVHVAKIYASKRKFLILMRKIKIEHNVLSQTHSLKKRFS